MTSVLFVAFGVVTASLSFDTYDDHCPGVAYRLLKGQGLGGQFACSAGETRRFLIAVLLTVVGVCVGVFVGVYTWRTRGESGRPNRPRQWWRRRRALVGRASSIVVIALL